MAGEPQKSSLHPIHDPQISHAAGRGKPMCRLALTLSGCGLKQNVSAR
jgi:hypothetical protein